MLNQQRLHQSTNISPPLPTETQGLIVCVRSRSSLNFYVEDAITTKQSAAQPLASRSEKDTDVKKATAQPITLNPVAETALLNQSEEQKSSQPEPVAFSVDWLGRPLYFLETANFSLKVHRGGQQLNWYGGDPIDRSVAEALLRQINPKSKP